MKKTLSILLLTVLLLPGCKDNNKNKAKKPAPIETARVDIPLADDDIRSFFDDDLGEFAFLEDNDTIEADEIIVAHASQENQKTDIETSSNEFAWVDEVAENDEDTCKVIYFDFDKYSINEEQQEAIEQDIAYVKKELEGAKEDATVIVEGHACHSAGSAVYNLALSGKRAKVVADRFAADGITVKTVGRGDEIPAIINGEKVSGGRQEQALNRRVEVKLIHS